MTLSKSGVQLSAFKVDVSNSTLVYASFQLDLTNAGVYDIVVTSHGQTTTLPSAFTVTNGSVNQVTVTATGPSSIRFGWTGSVAVTVTNVGDSDVTVPIIRVSADLLGAVAAPGSTDYGRSAELVNPNFSSEETGPLPPSVLPPGDAGDLPFPGAGRCRTRATPTRSTRRRPSPAPIRRDRLVSPAGLRPTQLPVRRSVGPLVNDVAAEVDPPRDGPRQPCRRC